MADPDRPHDPSAPLLRLILGGLGAQVARALTVLGVADRMGGDAWAAADLAAALDLHPPSLERLLQAAARFDLAEPLAGDFRLTALGLGLTSDRLGPVAAMYAGDHFWATQGGLAESVRTGRTATDLIYGEGSSFEAYARDRNLAAGFNAAMTALSDLIGPAVAVAYPFAGLVVDVGGGEGRLLAHILNAHPDARGLVLEVPKVAKKARAFLAGLRLSERCGVAAGDMFEAIPAGGDIYVLSAVIHDWNDADALAALKSVRRAMRPDARLVLVERVLADTPVGGAGDEADVLTDLLMMVRNGGRERTASAWRALLAEAGFDMLQIVPLAAPRQLIEARPG